MAMGKKKKRLLKKKHRNFLLWVLTIISLTLAIAHSVNRFISSSQEIIIVDPAQKAPPDNSAHCQILIDTSEDMATYFDGLTKWEVAKNAVNDEFKMLAEKYDKIGLRIFGGECTVPPNPFENECDKLSRLVVEFGNNNKKTIRDSLESIELYGRKTLFCGLTKSVHDYLPLNIVNPEKRIIILTSGIDTCDFGPIDHLKSRLEENDIDPKIRLIGLSVTNEERKLLDTFSDSIKAEKYDVVYNAFQLKRAIRGLPILEILPDSIKQILLSSNLIGNQLIRLSNQLKPDTFERANPTIISAKREIQNFEHLLQANRTTEPNFIRYFYNRIDSLFSIQKSMVSLADSIFQFHNDDIEKVIEFNNDWNDNKIPDYRRRRGEIISHLNQYYQSDILRK
jgi:hypothetical protein